MKKQNIRQKQSDFEIATQIQYHFYLQSQHNALAVAFLHNNSRYTKLLDDKFSRTVLLYYSEFTKRAMSLNISKIETI